MIACLSDAIPLALLGLLSCYSCACHCKQSSPTSKPSLFILSSSPSFHLTPIYIKYLSKIYSIVFSLKSSMFKFCLVNLRRDCGCAPPSPLSPLPSSSPLLPLLCFLSFSFILFHTIQDSLFNSYGDLWGDVYVSSFNSSFIEYSYIYIYIHSFIDFTFYIIMAERPCDITSPLAEA